jgi:hypothetical protein
MSDHGSVPRQGVPTLTEVVAWPDVVQPVSAAPNAEVDEAALVESASGFEARAASMAVLPSEEQMVQRVLTDLQRQIDLMLEYRLREALTPVLARAADGIIRDARGELASTLRDIVARAVAQEVARHRIR